jgi:rhodanese-related sulfurtransferase
MQFISAHKLYELRTSKATVTILDIRECYEYEICNINSLHIPMGEINTRYSEIPTDIQVVVMCKSGKRAEALTNLLETEYNFTNLYVLEGGILSWIKQVDTQLEVY